MKKILALALALVMMLGSVAALADGVTIGQVQFAAHGTKCFAVITVAMQDGKIAAAYIDEFQFMSPEGMSIADLETLLNANDSASMIDVVSGATLVDTYGYLQGILAAAKAAE